MIRATAISQPYSASASRGLQPRSTGFVGSCEQMTKKAATKTCIFCGASLAGNRSKEDIIPVWLQEFTNMSGLMVTARTYRPSAVITAGVQQRTTINQRTHNVGSLLAGNVCRQECNN